MEKMSPDLIDHDIMRQVVSEIAHQKAILAYQPYLFVLIGLVIIFFTTLFGFSFLKRFIPSKEYTLLIFIEFSLLYLLARNCLSKIDTLAHQYESTIVNTEEVKKEYYVCVKNLRNIAFNKVQKTKKLLNEYDNQFEYYQRLTRKQK